MTKILVTTIIMLAIIPALYAKEYQLEYRASVGHAMSTTGQRLTPMIKPDEKLVAEPEYRSLAPIYATATFGNGEDNKYTVIFDESQGTNKGYDILYVDRNNNEDLTDDPVIEMQGYGIRRPGLGMDQFNPAEVLIKSDGKENHYPFMAQIRVYDKKQSLQEDKKTLNGVYISLNAYGIFTRSLPLDKSNPRIRIEDSNCNGLFNDFYKIDSGIISSNRAYDASDKVNIKYENIDLWQGDFCAKYIMIDGDWYYLDIAEDGSKINLEKYDSELGIIRVPYHIDNLKLYSESGVITARGISTMDDKGKVNYDFKVPTGVYLLCSYSMWLNPSSADSHINADGTNFIDEIHIEGNEIFDLNLGPPLFTNVYCSPADSQQAEIKAGDKVILSLTFTGQAGEEITGIQRRSALPKPTFEAIDEDGQIVAKGEFKYG